MVLGAILLAAGIFGGGIKVKELEIPQLTLVSRILAAEFGVALVSYGLYTTSQKVGPVSNSELKPFACSAAESLKSAKTDEDTSILFINETDKPVKGFWIDFDGNKKEYFNLGPKDQGNDHLKQKTYEGHPWLIEDEQGHCLAAFVATAQDTVARIVEK